MSDKPEILKDTTEAAWDRVKDMSPFETWWYIEGSLLGLQDGESVIDHAERVSALAWAGGADEEKNREKKI